MTSANLAGRKSPTGPARVASADQCSSIWFFTPFRVPLRRTNAAPQLLNYAILESSIQMSRPPIPVQIGHFPNVVLPFIRPLMISLMVLTEGGTLQ